MSIDLSALGREIKKPVADIETALKLLDEGNTIPFITRFRKDQTGGLNEEQLLSIKTAVSKLRALAERKAFITKSIDSQGKLTDKLGKQIEAATTSRQLEDLYLAFRPKKQTLATVARQKGLEPLANDIFEGREPEKDLATRATDFVRVDKDLNSVDEVIAGVGHILAEKFSDNMNLRGELRAIMSKGKLATQLIELEQPTETRDEEAKGEENPSSKTDSKPAEPPTETAAAKEESQPDPTSAAAESDQSESATVEKTDDSTAAGSEQPVTTETSAEAETSSTTTDSDSAEPKAESKAALPKESSDGQVSSEQTATAEGTESTAEKTPADQPAAEQKPKLKKKKKKKKKKVDDPYKEFHDFAHPISSISYYKTLAINRGEKSGRLKVKLQFDDQDFLNHANKVLVPEEHPFKEFLQTCVKDAMSRMVIPSLERELRREITEAAEQHAVSVFARNLKSLLLQTPTRDRIVLAIDPGYKRGCSVAVVDCGGQLLADSHIFVVGNDSRKQESKQKLLDLIKDHNVQLIAIGNGAACREAEQLVSELIAENESAKNLKYAMVNEAGASHYSTSEVGREEFPDLTPAVRSAISIGRRLIDPLSELVKIAPANIGVGLYQHDIKAKHLAESLDDVVQFCVNRVGVDVNTASPSILRYVSGLNQLTARRVFEFRQEQGPFNSREQLKQVAGFGDATFVQSAGFLRVRGGEQPLDTSGVHPDHYEAAQKLIDKVGGKVEELFPIATQLVEKTAAPETEKSEQAVAPVASETINTPEPDSAPQETPANTDSGSQTTDKLSEKTSDSAKPESDATAKPNAADEAATANVAEATNEAPPAESTASQPPADTGTADENAAPKDETSSENTQPSDSPAGEQTTGTESADSDKPSETPAPKIVARKVTLTDAQIARRKELVKSIRELDADKLAGEFGIGRLLLKDIVHSICRPEYDPRTNINRPIFRTGIIKLDDLSKDMCLDAQVVNVVDFGVFVDIGLGTSCLVHVSQLANHFIRDPHRFFAVGDTLRVWVTEIDMEKRRVKLTAVQPNSLRPKRRDAKPKSFRKPSGPRKGGNRQGHGQGHGKHSETRRKFTKARKPKPVKPITEEMRAGAEPMRSFSDLAQFYDKKPEGKDKKGKS